MLMIIQDIFVIKKCVCVYVCVRLCSGALKSYLRELPEPLMTFGLYDEWLQASWYTNSHTQTQTACQAGMHIYIYIMCIYIYIHSCAFDNFTPISVCLK